VQRQEEFWRLAQKHKHFGTAKKGVEEEDNQTSIPLALGNDTASPSADMLLDSLHLQEDFFSQLVQELRMPLTNMKTALTLLESAQLKPAQRQRYMQLLHTQCDRQNSLLTGLLELLHLEYNSNTVLQPLHLIDIIPAVVSTYQPLAQEKGILLGYTVSDHLPTVSCLETWLRQIAINLLHNSIKFTPAGGQVLVQAKLQGDRVQLEFRDTGMGIGPNEIGRIFEPFYRGRPALGEDSAGAGLGLTIVHQLLTLCGGSISVTSKLGEGSSFKVQLPVAHQV
jgi:signal transduction histidine kinase